MIVCLLAAGPDSLAPLPRHAPLERLLTPDEYRQYLKNPKYKQRIDVYREGISRMEPELRGYVREGRFAKARELLGRIHSLVLYALREHSREGASTRDLHAGEAKRLEIFLRRLIKNLKDQRLIVPPEYRREFEAVTYDAGVLRAQLLRGIFR